MHDLDDIHGLLDEINSITLDDPKDDYLLEPGDDLDGHLTDSTWGYVPHVTLRDSADKGAGFVIDFENLTSLLPSCSDGGLTRGSYSEEEQQGSTSHDFDSMEKAESGATGMLAQEELCAPTRAPDDSNVEGYNNYHCSIVPGMNIDADVGEGNVDGDPPKRSEYDQINKGEAITITKVLAGTDVKEKDNTVIVATESDTHIKIIGYNCGYYDACDYWDEYDIRDEDMEVKYGTRLTPASNLSPCKALLRAGDFVFTGQPPGGYNASGGHDYNFDHNFKISDMGTTMKDKGLRLALGG